MLHAIVLQEACNQPCRRVLYGKLLARLHQLSVLFELKSLQQCSKVEGGGISTQV